MFMIRYGNPAWTVKSWPLHESDWCDPHGYPAAKSDKIRYFETKEEAQAHVDDPGCDVVYYAVYRVQWAWRWVGRVASLVYNAADLDNRRFETAAAARKVMPKIALYTAEDGCGYKLVRLFRKVK